MDIDEDFDIVSECLPDGLRLCEAVLHGASWFKVAGGTCVIGESPSDKFPAVGVGFAAVFNECVNCAAAVVGIAGNFVARPSA